MEELDKSLLKQQLKEYIKQNFKQDIDILEDIEDIEDIEENDTTCKYSCDCYGDVQDSTDNYLYTYLNKLQNFNDILRQLIRDYNKKHNTKDSDIYKKANISREHFNKIINQKINPSKIALISLSIALELSRTKTNYLLNCAGFALTNTEKFDLVIMYCLDNHIYNINTINDLLYDNNIQKTLGSNTKIDSCEE